MAALSFFASVSWQCFLAQRLPRGCHPERSRPYLAGESKDLNRAPIPAGARKACVPYTAQQLPPVFVFNIGMRLASRIALALIVLATAAAARDYSATGPFEVKVADETLHDSTRNKDVPVRVYFPESRAGAPAPHDARFPIIVFSHGAGGSGNSYQNWGRHWASYGYVSIHPTH